MSVLDSIELDWSNPDYRPVLEERAGRLRKLQENPQLVTRLLEYYKDKPAEFVGDWMWTFDPRAAELGLETTMPFVLFPKQREYLDWLYARWRGREDCVVEKSRDMGASWLCCGFSVWMWICHPGTLVGIGSRKEEYVDKIGDPKSLFWKIRFLLQYLPKELLPEGYDEKKHAPSMRVVNPVNGSSIIGEAGDNIGRGARSSAQPLDAKILTPRGWIEMGEVVVGDYVIGGNGKPTRVVQIHPKGTRKVYRVMFSDGSSTECCGEHLWEVTTANMRKSAGRSPKRPRGDNAEKKVLSTERLMADFLVKRTDSQIQYNYQIPMVSQVWFDGEDLPLDPYVLGALIGDGCLSNINRSTIGFTSEDEELVQEIRSRLPDHCVIEPDGGQFGYRITDSRVARGRGHMNPVKKVLFDLGLDGKKSHDKYIPDSYKFAADPKDRLEFLRGLLDTDGWVSIKKNGKSSQISYCSTSERLVDDVVFIVQSLGGVCGNKYRKPASSREFPTSGLCNTRENWSIILSLPDGINPFKLSRKANKVKARLKYAPRRAIVGIDVVGHKDVQCITVGNEDGLYVTNDCIVTHNCYFVDEAAFLERPEAVDAALSQTSNCKWHVSTPNGSGNPFYQKAHGGRIPKFVFDWRDDPRKSQDWYEKQCAILDPVVVAQEIDRDYEASVSNAFIGGSIVSDAMMKGPADVGAKGGLRIGIDVARFGNDRTVITFRRGRVLLKQVKLEKLDVMQVAGRARSEIRAYGETPEQIAVDTIGIGAGVADALRGYFPDRFDRDGRRIRTVVDVNAAIRMDNGQDYNMRAYMWREMREWLKEASIPNDPDLRTDLTSLRYGFKGGELLLESKEDAKRRGVKSPDGADSLALTFAYPTVVAPVFKSFNRVEVFEAFDESVGY